MGTHFERVACLAASPLLRPPQDKLTQRQAAGRALTIKGAKGRGGGSGSGSDSSSNKERHNLVLDLGNHAQETITDMQRNFVQVGNIMEQLLLFWHRIERYVKRALCMCVCIFFQS